MPKVRALVPIEHEGKPIAAGQEFDADDAQAAEWRAAGKVTLLSDEETAAQASESGHYSDVVGRDDVATPQPGPSGGPQDDDDEDKPKAKKK